VNSSRLSRLKALRFQLCVSTGTDNPRKAISKPNVCDNSRALPYGSCFGRLTNQIPDCDLVGGPDSNSRTIDDPQCAPDAYFLVRGKHRPKFRNTSLPAVGKVYSCLPRSTPNDQFVSTAGEFTNKCSTNSIPYYTDVGINRGFHPLSAESRFITDNSSISSLDLESHPLLSYNKHNFMGFVCMNRHLTRRVALRVSSYRGVKSCEYTPCSRCRVSESSFSTRRCTARTQPILAALMERWRGNSAGICIDVYVIVQRLYVKVTLWKNPNNAS
jgi:hypothetical protein